MVVISYSHAFKALGVYIENYNCDVDYKDRVKSSVLLTAEKLIRIYGVALVKANQVQPVDPGDLPSLRTNSVQLAKSAKCSVRTIRRHINRLMAARIIVKKVFHGSNADFELWLNPAILQPTERPTPVVELPPQAQDRKPERSHVKTTDKGTSCPHTDTGNKRYHVSNILIDVDNNAGYSANPVEKRCSLSRTSVEITGNSTGNQKTGDTRKVVRLRAETTGNETPDSTRSATLSLYASLLWKLALNSLYSNTTLTDWQKDQARALIHKLYEPVPDKQLASVHRQYCERISLARQFVERDPQKRFIPLPYIYFNTSNPDGFRGTKEWHRKYTARKKQVAQRLVLEAQIRKYVRNQVTGAKPSLQVFRECEARIGKLNSPALLREFHAAILDQSTNQQLYSI